VDSILEKCRRLRKRGFDAKYDPLSNVCKINLDKDRLTIFISERDINIRRGRE